MGKKRRSFSKDFKLEAVKLVKEGGLSAGRAAKDLGIYETSLRRWMKQYEIDQGKGPAGALTTGEKEELCRLRREVRTLRRDQGTRDVPNRHTGNRDRATCHDLPASLEERSSLTCSSIVPRRVTDSATNGSRVTRPTRSCFRPFPTGCTQA